MLLVINGVRCLVFGFFALPLPVVWSALGPVSIVWVKYVFRRHCICPTFFHVPIPLSKSVSSYPAKMFENTFKNQTSSIYKLVAGRGHVPGTYLRPSPTALILKFDKSYTCKSPFPNDMVWFAKTSARAAKRTAWERQNDL